MIGVFGATPMRMRTWPGLSGFSASDCTRPTGTPWYRTADCGFRPVTAVAEMISYGFSWVRSRPIQMAVKVAAASKTSVKIPAMSA
ncbi:hypothetical protein D3C72_1098910 [compost metagenome]